MSRRAKRPSAKPGTIAEWARQYPQATVTRIELVDILQHFALAWAPELPAGALPQADGDPGDENDYAVERAGA